MSNLKIPFVGKNIKTINLNTCNKLKKLKEKIQK